MPAWHELPWTLKSEIPGWAPVTAHGAIGDGVTDDTAAIQAAIDNSPTGSVVWFPAGTYLVSATIRLAPYRAYVGAGGRAQLTRIKAAPGLVGGALLAARGWWDNATVCDNPIRVEGLYLDASSATGAHGLVVYHFWSHFEDIQVGNVDGPNAAGILATDRGRDGNTLTTNSHSENTFVRCRFLEHTSRATGFRAESNNGLSNQDGHLLDGFYAGISGDAIRITRAAGWSVENNHLYGIGYNGIALSNCYATKVQRNYVEDFGGADGANNGAGPTYGYFNGIAMETILDTRASIIAENTVSTSQPSSPAGNRWVCFFARAGWGQRYANVVLVGNTAVFVGTSAPATRRSWAYRLGEGEDPGNGETPARMLQVEWAGNQIQDVDWWQGTRSVETATVALTEPGTGDVDLSGYVLTTDPRLSNARTPTAHNHAASEVTSGTFAIARIPTGTTGTTVALGNDARFSDARTPTAHAHAATDITSGTFAVARLPVGTAAGTVAAGNDSRLSDARTPTAHAHSAADLTSGTVPTDRIPNVLHPPITASGTGNYTVDASAGTDWYLTATGNRTLTISGGADGQMIVIDVLASGGARTITLSGVTLTTGMVSPFAIPSGKVGTIGLRRTNGTWRCLAQTVDQ